MLPIRQRPNNSIIKIDNVEKQTYSDQTGRLPVTSIRVYECIIVMYNKDSDAILVKPIKLAKETELTSTLSIL